MIRHFNQRSKVTYITYVAAFLLAAAGSNVRAQENARWAATWTASPQAVLPPEAGFESGVPATLTDQTVRQVVHVSSGGRRVRIVLSNAYGKMPLTVGEVHIARTAQPANLIVAGSDRLLTFAGETHAVIPPGAPLVSDPVELDVSRESDLTVSAYLPEATAVDTYHWTGQQTAYIAQGNVAAAESLAYTATVTARLFLSAVFVARDSSSRVVAAFGDSITDGSSATIDANSRWPDVLAQRVTPYGVGVINAGISGNQLLADGMGVNALARFERDVLAQPGVDAAIVLIGINDISGFATGKVPTSATLIAGFRQLIAQAHSRGVRILGATITPFERALEGFADGYYTPEKEQVRVAVNDWIRSSGAFDAVVDFDAELRDPERPTLLRAEYDSGDHLHPNDAGYRAMAEAITLSDLFGRR